MILTIFVNYVFTAMKNQSDQIGTIATDDITYTFYLKYVDESGKEIQENLNCVLYQKNHKKLVESCISELSIDSGDEVYIQLDKFGLTMHKNDNNMFDYDKSINNDNKIQPGDGNLLLIKDLQFKDICYFSFYNEKTNSVKNEFIVIGDVAEESKELFTKINKICNSKGLDGKEKFITVEKIEKYDPNNEKIKVEKTNDLIEEETITKINPLQNDSNSDETDSD